MYNPEYCARPHVVALNKMDIAEAADLQVELAEEVRSMAQRIQVQHSSTEHTAQLCCICVRTASSMAVSNLCNFKECLTVIFHVQKTLGCV